MADMNQLTQLVVDASSDDFYFLAEVSGRSKVLWVSLFIKGKIQEHVFFGLVEIDAAIKWVEEQRAKHGGVK